MLAREIRQQAGVLGFGAVGFTDTAPFARWAEEMDRRKEAESGIWDRYKLTADPLAIMSQAKTVIMLAWPYVPYTGQWPQGYLRWSAYYECRGPARQALGALIGWLGAQGIDAVEAHDQVPLKEAAVRAGLGVIGLNQLLITPRWGSCVYLGAVLIDKAVTEEKKVLKPLPCQQCQRCVAACPTKALDSDGTFHREKCLRHYMLSAGVIPAPIRSHLANDLVGCDICQRVCPQNHGQYKEERQPDPETLSCFSIEDILREWETGLKDRMARMAPVIGANYARANKVLCAALIASRDVPMWKAAVGQALAHPHPHIRRYAAWALSFHPGADVGDLLRDTLSGEKDEGVREEIAAALDRWTNAGDDIEIGGRIP